MNKSLPLLFLILCNSCFYSFAQDFQKVNIPEVQGVYYADLRWGDFNKDQALDLVIGSPNSFQVLLQDQGGFYVLDYDTLKLETQLTLDAIDLADLNGDNFIDLLISGGPNVRVFDLLENKNGLFYRYSNFGFPFNFGLAGFSSFGDADQDGDPDILYGGWDGWSNKRNGLYLNKQGAFIQINHLVEETFGYAFWGDIDGDLDLDIVGHEMGSYSTFGNYIGTNDGKASFTRISSSSDLFLYDAQQADYNQDQQMDYLLKVGDRYELFTITTEGLQQVEGVQFQNSYSAHWADFNNDGWPDILFYGGDFYCYYAGCSTYIYYNNEGKSFSLQEIPEIPGMDRATSAVADYDGDGDLDIAIAGNGEFSLFKNLWIEKGNAKATPLMPPSNLSHLVEGNEVVLSWEKPADPKLSSQSFTFNVYLRREDGTFVQSPLADLSSGKRYVPVNGNTALANKHKLKCLPDGTYYWAVQTINAAYTGSEFSEERKIIISGNSIKKPLSLSAKVLSNDKVGLKWSDMADNEEEYLVYRRMKGTEFSPFHEPISVLPPDSEAFTDHQDLSSGTDYVYRVVAANCSYPLKSYAEVEASTFPEAYSESEEFYLDHASGTFSSFADLDNDGDLDLLVSYRNEVTKAVHASRIFLKEKDGYVGTGQEFAVMDNQTPFQWVDFNQDGYLDLWFYRNPSFYGTRYLQILLNNKSGLFYEDENFSIDLSSFSFSWLFWEDVDRDGKLDLLMQGPWHPQGYRNISFLRNTGNFQFKLVENLELEGTLISHHPWADYDNDGDLDFFAVRSDGCGTNFWVLYKQLAPFHFQEEKLDNIPALDDGFNINNTQAIWLDYDSDGWLDILFSGADYCGNGSGITRLLKNEKGSFKLASETSFSPEINDIALNWGDYDNDGDVDIFLYGDPFSSGFPQNTRIYAYNAAEGYQESSVNNILISTHEGHMAMGDVEWDGDLDLLVLGEKDYVTPKIILYKSNLAQSWNRPNTRPSSPANLKEEQLETGIRLSWDPASDAETPEKGLSYNVYVKDQEGNYIILPYATEAGFSTRMGIGNAQKNTFIIIKGLPKGTYSWGVQAVDNGHMGSEFSPSKDFVKEKEETIVSATTAEQNLFSFQLYPNPAEKRQVMLKFPEFLSGHFTLQLRDLSGKLLFQYSGQIPPSNEAVLPLNNFSSGIYFVTLRKGNKVATQRLLLK